MNKHYDKELSEKTVPELISMHQLVPPYMASAWKEIPKKYTLKQFRAIAEILLALSKDNEWKAKCILLDEWINDGSVLGVISRLSYQGVGVVQKVLTMRSGSLSKQNKMYLADVCQQHAERAYKYYKKAAYDDDSEAQYQYACLLESGMGVSKDLAQATVWYRISAKGNNEKALFRLGAAFQNGDLFDQDYSNAVYYYTLAANEGHGLAQCLLGFCYEQGYGVNKDMSNAIACYRRSVESDCPFGFALLGACYFFGKGIKEDKEKAFSLLYEGARKGSKDCQWQLGLCYHHGAGTDQNDSEAEYWLKESADAGDLNAQSFLEQFYKERQN